MTPRRRDILSTLLALFMFLLGVFGVYNTAWRPMIFNAICIFVVLYGCWCVYKIVFRRNAAEVPAWKKAACLIWTVLVALSLVCNHLLALGIIEWIWPLAIIGSVGLAILIDHGKSEP